MKIFFRKHGNSLFYVLLPVLFLVLTVAFIQLTPKNSRSTVGDTCTDADGCCNSSGCGVDIGEACSNDTCERTNVGCVLGDVVDSPDGTCDCVDNGAVVGTCVVCAVDENFIGGNCVRLCGPDEDPDVTGCFQVEASGPATCAGSLNPLATPEGAGFMSYGFAVANLVFLGLRFRRKH
jgi:hypothetical protein